MTPSEIQKKRLQFLVRVVRRECMHLTATDSRLFAENFTTQRAKSLDDYPDEAERVEAFVGRFGRLQDTLGDKLLPAYLAAPDRLVFNRSRVIKARLLGTRPTGGKVEIFLLRKLEGGRFEADTSDA